MGSAAGTQDVQIDAALAPAMSDPLTHSPGVASALRRPDSVLLLLVIALFLAGSVLMGLARGAGAAAYLGEWTVATFASAAQMVGCALLLTITCVRRRQFNLRECERRGSRTSWALWALMAAGFLFLAADEVFEFHERFDLYVHSALSMVETPLSDRIDDGIVLLYGVIGLAVLSRGRSELCLLRAVWPVLRTAFFLLFAMVIFDLLTNRWFAPRGIDPESGAIKSLAQWGTVAEESLKLASGAMFVIAFAAVARAAKVANAATALYPAHREQ